MADSGPNIPHGLTLWGGLTAGFALVGGILSAWVGDRLATAKRIQEVKAEAEAAQRAAAEAREASAANGKRLDQLNREMGNMSGKMELILAGLTKGGEG